MRLPIARVLPLLSPAHLDRDFDYLVPPELDEIAQPGVRVRVRFAGRLVDGYLLARSAHTDHGGKLVKLERVVSGERVLTPEILELAGAVAARYAGTRADVLRLAIPPRHARTETGGRKTSSAAHAVSPESVVPDPASSVNPERADEVSIESIGDQTSFDSRSAYSDVAEMETANLGDGSAPADGDAVVARERSTAISASGQPLTADGSADGADEPGAVGAASGQPHTADDDAAGAGEPSAGSSATGQPRRPETDNDEPPAGMTSGQREELSVDARIDAEQDAASEDRAGRGDSRVPLEHMDVASWGRYVHGAAFVDALAQGKGARAAWQALPGEDWPRRLAELAAVVAAQGRSAIVMVPDQRDLDRVLAECVRLVGDSAVGLAAGLGPAARYRRWLAVLRGSARVVVGTRSAVFAPAVDLGLIAVWDDGDDTYAEPRAPYPHAREVAMLRAHETGAAFVAAGFARTAEIQAVVDSGWAHDLVADRAVLRKAAPRISAPGDSDIALERDPVARAVRIPGVAFAAARAALKEGAPVLVQVPRRGYIPALACGKCRTPARCRHCNGPLALPEARASRGSAAEAGAAAQSPACRWCGITEAAFRCTTCGSRALRAVVIGAARTAEELGRAFPGVPIRGSGGGTVLDAVEPGPQVVVSTVGAEPVVPGGYGVALLLDGWALLGRADLRAAEDALRRWMAAAALVRAHGQVIVVAEPAIPTVQALVRWDPVGAGGPPGGGGGAGG
ncbi:hypothetical protein, partial [Nocardia asiatica]|uniref:primosomal protein N' family DNA-binding protein n=1 Tax=Nocardia asiatica TaxID=209252 RepID=UPI002454BE7A